MTLIVPFSAGGTTDVVIRALAAVTEKHVGQPIVIENRGGAGGTLGPAQMATGAKPDGYTISQLPFVVFREPAVRKTSYDPAKDFSYIIGVSAYTFGVAVRSDAPWRTFSEFLADAKARPGQINYGITASNGLPNTTMLQIAKLQDIRLISVPFKGVADAINALLGGHIDAIADSTGWAAQVNAGQFRQLVFFSEARTKNWPEVPTLRETGIDLVATGPFGIAGPKGIDPEIIKALHDAFRKGMDETPFRDVLARLNQEPWYLNSEDYRNYALAMIEQEKRVVRELGLKAE
ncbi:tripartite tricarboxylate transporter substrate binding protein [Bradyrhizobium sp. SSUT112]|uniref:tripartite tricarboxylate transporter substrate binding protein n=1 Tax=Bradyrhizobium sp. SSUT112 TaxID=3040604 RepID=UPI002446B2C2|nr:tripartite tricarboxylate transporter substrate binding protein [Bradyrhizobium sp. SSUT112]MDH2351194.1 tripartite tricarboxylate transporter substrate binding protein [Bradyrhizobium sp. SSUT112]